MNKVALFTGISEQTWAYLSKFLLNKEFAVNDVRAMHCCLITSVKVNLLWQ